jgi:hypothetical protein
MAKSRLNDFSTSADANTDVGGIGIQGTNKPRNLDDAIRYLMKTLADWRDTLSLNDTASFNDVTDATKAFRIDAGDVPTGTTRVINAESLYRLTSEGALPRVMTYYQTAGTFTHTLNTKTTKFRLFLMGAGGDGGNVDGQGSGTGASASGGNSGNWGWTAFLTKGSIVSGTLVVGAAGTAATGTTDDGCDGNDTTWSDGTNSYTCKGGKGGIGRLAGGQYGVSAPVANSANTGTLYGSYAPGGVGQGSATFNVSVAGGSTEFGTCLPAGLTIGAATAGNNAVGNGSGGGGAAVAGVGANAVGGRGAPGMAIVVEY